MTPDAVLARPLSLASYPVATGRPRPGHQRPRALRVIDKINAGPPQPAETEIGDGAAEAIRHNCILRRASLFGTHAPRDKENQPEKCRRESTPEPPDAVLARPLSLASYPVATGRPRPGQQRPRARGRVIDKVNAAPRCCFGAPPLVGELPRSNGQTTAWPAAPSRPRKGDR